MKRIPAVMALTASVLLAAACSASPSSTGTAGSPGTPGSQSTHPSALAFSRCMRSHGVPDFPDPPATFEGKFPGSNPQQLGVSDSRFRAATTACQTLLPPVPGQDLTAQERQDYLRGAACMRSHGITNFPDPDFSGGVRFAIPSSIDTRSARFTLARQTCERLIPAGLPYSSGS